MLVAVVLCGITGCSTSEQVSPPPSATTIIDPATPTIPGLSAEELVGDAQAAALVGNEEIRPVEYDTHVTYTVRSDPLAAGGNAFTSFFYLVATHSDEVRTFLCSDLHDTVETSLVLRHCLDVIAKTARKSVIDGAAMEAALREPGPVERGENRVIYSATDEFIRVEVSASRTFPNAEIDITHVSILVEPSPLATTVTAHR